MFIILNTIKWLGGIYMFWKLYWLTPKRMRKEFVRQHFWGWLMNHHLKIYKWCDKHLPFDTLPF